MPSAIKNLDPESKKGFLHNTDKSLKKKEKKLITINSPDYILNR